MAGKFLLEVVTPEKLLLSQHVDDGRLRQALKENSVCCRATAISFPRYDRRASVSVGDLTNYMSVLWGFAEVTPKVTVMAEIAEKAEDIDFERCRGSRRKGRRALKAGGLPSDLKEAEISLEKARLRKKIAERARRS